MASKVFLTGLGMIVAVGVTGGAALPALAEGGLTTLGSGGSQYSSGIAASGVAFIKIAPDDNLSASNPLQQHRFGPALVSAIEPVASVKPWIGSERAPNRNSFGLAGVLVDVPLGKFVFTPSFGGGRYTESDGRDQSSVIQLRSSVELGYRFDDQSRVSLDYRHTTTTAQTIGGPVGGSALAFTYRIPSARLLGN